MTQRIRLIPLALGVAAFSCAEPDHGPFRHVVLISLDTTRADHLDPWGDLGLTPHIGTLAQEGVVFESALTPAPTTLAAHTSIMTGCYPHTHGVPRNGFMVDRRNVMLAELLADAGFHTAGFLGSFALESLFDFDQGFDAFDEDFDLMAFADEDVGRDQNQRTADRVTDAVLAHVESVEADRMFLFVHYFDAHQPYEPPADFARRYANPGELQTSSAREMGAVIHGHTRRILGEPVGVKQLIERGLDPRLIEESDGTPLGFDSQLANLYAGEVAFVDSQIGRLLDGLASAGVLEDALLILTGDHGETFWEHGDFWNHGLWVYETTVHVPLVMRFPDGRGAGRRVRTPVSTVDIVPTLCELLGIELPPRVDGESLAGALEDDPFVHDVVYSQATQPLRVEPRGDVWRNIAKPRCIRSGRWKYVQAPYLGGGRPRDLLTEPGLEQLFDLRDDPGETNNLLRGELSAEAAAARDRMSAALGEWARSADPLPTVFNEEQYEQILETLQELGYAGNRLEDEDE